MTFETAPPTAEEWLARYRAITVEATLPFLVATVNGSPGRTAPDPEVVGYAYLTPWRSKPGYRHTVEDTVYVAPRSHRPRPGTSPAGRPAPPRRRRRRPPSHRRDRRHRNPASAALHQACGFVHAGRLHHVGYKHDRWIATLLMQHTIST